MKENTDDARPRKTTPKTTAKVSPKAAAPVAKETSPKAPKTPRSKKVSPEPAAEEKKTVRVSRRSSSAKNSVITPAAEEVAVAAFLNWCQRRNQGLPDDPIADWITAESDMGLVN